MREVQPHLYLGNALDARDLRRLYDLQIAAVIDLALEELPAQLGREIIYCRFPLIDGGGNPTWLLRAAVETTLGLLNQAVPTLVACSGGMSRSPAILAAALSIAQGRDPAECLVELVQGHPREVSPPLWADALRLVGTWKSDSVS
jgi:protein-tyrosine phosphatase